ncbi:hypothetical protein BDN72DRAFT_891005 [Pluteus cervinus]|uniref:Uncharacterized protein n=1 Tax=Pluteus cervinus TaxID=181527 RepID=A0ACD3BGT4_9AGAR|nr:hypothetical protein BDN72DRAFT_891005 [Pluteus cervinus]
MTSDSSHNPPLPIPGLATLQDHVFRNSPAPVPLNAPAQPLPQPQWPFMGALNPLQQQQQQFNPQMQAQAMPPQLQALAAAMSFPFLTQQLLNPAFSAPLTKTDEPLLVNALVEALRKGESYKDAINGLHSQNGHGAHLWKDYYLDHKHRIDEAVTAAMPSTSRGRDPIDVKAVKPRPAFRVEQSPSTSSTTSTPQPARKLKQPQPLKLPAPKRRNTINSLTVPEPVFGDHLPPPNADIKIPPPPSRSPSPPQKLIPHKGRGFKYTPEDRDFFIKFISWRLKQDSNLSRLDLCAQLAEKAPHHTAQSWQSYWSNHHDIPDKILAAARGEDIDDSEPESEKEIVSLHKPHYAELSTDDDGDGEGGSESSSESESEDDDSDTPLKTWSESEMAGSGESFNEADLYFMAKRVADFPDFAVATGAERWHEFSNRHPQRSQKSWAEGYRRYAKLIHKIADKIRSKGASTSKPALQIGRRTAGGGPRSKRKLEVHSEINGRGSLEKRPRYDEEQ